jgi:hypothetical protein
VSFLPLVDADPVVEDRIMLMLLVAALLLLLGLAVLRYGPGGAGHDRS